MNEKKMFVEMFAVYKNLGLCSLTFVGRRCLYLCGPGHGTNRQLSMQESHCLSDNSYTGSAIESNIDIYNC